VAISITEALNAKEVIAEVIHTYELEGEIWYCAQDLSKCIEFNYLSLGKEFKRRKTIMVSTENVRKFHDRNS